MIRGRGLTVPGALGFLKLAFELTMARQLNSDQRRTLLAGCHMDTTRT
jgi:hypothetical protein